MLRSICSTKKSKRDQCYTAEWIYHPRIYDISKESSSKLHTAFGLWALLTILLGQLLRSCRTWCITSFFTAFSTLFSHHYECRTHACATLLHADRFVLHPHDLPRHWPLHAVTRSSPASSKALLSLVIQLLFCFAPAHWIGFEYPDWECERHFWCRVI